MRLTHITLSGTMQGPIWWPVGEICETEFAKAFAAPGLKNNPWLDEWTCLDDALQAALNCGDFQGGMGDLVCGEITFHLAGCGKRATKTRTLENMAAVKGYLAS